MLFRTTTLFTTAAIAVLFVLGGCFGTDPESTVATDATVVEPPVNDAAETDDSVSPVDADSDAANDPAENKDAFLAAARKGVTENGNDESTVDLPGTEPNFSDPEPAPADNENWLANYEAAKAQAKEEGKDILMDFTGSDWCGWCIRLHKEVFSKQDFDEYVKDKFVLLELDFPRGFELEPSIKKQNEDLQAKFQVQGFPTIMLTDADGRAYAQTGYQAGGPAAYNEHLDGLRDLRLARDEAFVAAEGLEGLEKAKKLDEGLAAVAQSLHLPDYTSIIEEIIKLDADNKGGLKEKHQSALLMHGFTSRMSEVETLARETEDWDAVLKALDEVAIEFKEFKEGQSQLNQFRLTALRAAKRTDELLELADRLIADETVTGKARMQVFVAKFIALESADRSEEALPVVDLIIKEFGDDQILRINMLLKKAELLLSLKQADAAKDTFELAKKDADPAIVRQIDQIAAQMLEAAGVKPEEKPSAAEEKPAATEEKPAATEEKPEEKKEPATE